MRIDFARPDREHQAIESDLEQAVMRVIRSGRSILGQEVDRFEEQFARVIGTKLAVGVSSGTDALATALYALEIRPGDEVIVGVFGFVAAPEAVVRVGARPVFVDMEPAGLGLDREQVARARSDRTRAVISVDLFGVAHDLEPIRRAAPGVPIVEDAAQALGASVGGRSAGTLGDIGTFSFFPSKALSAAGDGGACVTADERLARRMAQVRGHGAVSASPAGDFAGRAPWEILGGNYRLDALQAAVLSVKLRHLPARLVRRRAIGQRLAAASRRAGVEPIVGAGECQPAFAPLALRVAGNGRRDALLTRLRDGGIDVRVHYPATLAACPPFFAFAGASVFPEGDRATRELLSIPCHPEMTDEEVAYLEVSLGKALR